MKSRLRRGATRRGACDRRGGRGAPQARRSCAPGALAQAARSWQAAHRGRLLLRQRLPSLWQRQARATTAAPPGATARRQPRTRVLLKALRRSWRSKRHCAAGPSHTSFGGQATPVSAARRPPRPAARPGRAWRHAALSSTLPGRGTADEEPHRLCPSFAGAAWRRRAALARWRDGVGVVCAPGRWQTSRWLCVRPRRCITPPRAPSSARREWFTGSSCSGRCPDPSPRGR